MGPSTNRAGKASKRTLTAFGFLLIFGALMASLASTTLVWRGSILDHVWVLNPRAYNRLAPFGRIVGIPFLGLSVGLATAVGWFKRRLWGWRLAVAIIAVQILGDLINLFHGRVLEGGIGVAIAGALLSYLLRAPVKGVFASRMPPR
jgi:hypothetical protein